MIQLKACSPSMRQAGPAEIFDAMEIAFRQDWHSRIDDVGELIESLKVDAKLLRWFVARVGSQGGWPTMAGAQSFTMHASETMLARINLWFPPNTISSESYRRYLSIDEIHNHDFDFFTTCLHGDGYDSTFWEDSAFNENRRVGDKIHLTEMRELTLGQQDIWFIKASKDYHAQHWPKSFGVTLNILPNWRDRPTTIQYVLDGSHNIKTVIDSGLPPLDLVA